MNAISEVLKLGRPFKATSGLRVFIRGNPTSLFFYLISGRFLTRVTSASGRELIIAEAQPGEFLPINALFEGATYGADGIAQSDCEMMAIETAKLRKLLIHNSHVSYYFLQIALQRLQHRTEQFLDVALLNATGRIAKWLLEIAHQQSIHLHNGMILRFELSTRFIGLSTAGMSRETVSRQLSYLVSQGIINRAYKTITILDVAKLAALSEGNATSN